LFSSTFQGLNAVDGPTITAIAVKKYYCLFSFQCIIGLKLLIIMHYRGE
jgi:hypothetical protein